MEAVKYVIVMVGCMETLVIFPAWMGHGTYRDMGFQVVSAGFVGRSDRNPSGFYCFGRSETLGLKCRGVEDQRLLDLMFRKE